MIISLTLSRCEVLTTYNINSATKEYYLHTTYFRIRGRNKFEKYEKTNYRGGAVKNDYIYMYLICTSIELMLSHSHRPGNQGNISSQTRNKGCTPSATLLSNRA